MKKIFLSLSLLLPVAIAAAQAIPIPEIEQYKLSNGLKVYLVEYGQVPATYVSLYINSGKKNEIPGEQELSQIAASCVRMGSTKYSLDAMQNELFRLGTDIGAYSGDNYTTIASSFTNDSLDKGMDVFSNAVLHPTFPDKEINQMISQLVDYNNPSKLDIGALAGIYSRFWVYGASNPLGRYFYKDQLIKITPATIKEFYEFNYTPANSRLVICGKFDKSKLKAMIEKYFGAWTAPYGEVNGVSFDNPVIKKKEYAFINRSNATQSALHWTKTGPEPKSKEVLPFMIANAAFNEMLTKEIREKEGKTYGIGSGYNYYSNSNLITISTQVRSEEMLNTINLFDKVTRDFYNKGITQQELDKAKKQLRNEWLMIETPNSVIDFFNPIVFPKPEVRKNYLSEIDNLTIDDVNKMIKKYLTPDIYKLMIAGDQAKLQEQLKQIQGLKTFSPKDIEVNE